jgi:hypothetical protein
MSPRFLSQNMAQKEPEKKMPLMAANENHLFGEAGAGGVAPFKGLIGFALDAWYCFDGMEQV